MAGVMSCSGLARQVRVSMPNCSKQALRGWVFAAVCFVIKKLSWNPKQPYIYAIYSDLSRGHPEWWFSKGILPKMALIQVKDL